MTTEPGQVYMVDLGIAAKVRPMVVVSRRDDDAPRALSICAPITTSYRESKYEIAIGKPRFLEQKSFVNVQGLQAVQHHELKRMIGRLTEDQVSEIRKALSWTLDLS
jgi:mRNA interferase MazF